MGFRFTFLSHEGLVACHSEVVLHAFERTFTDNPLRMLLVGVGNGGSVEIWRKCLPEGSEVVAIDENPECWDLPIDVKVGPVHDKAWLLRTLGRPLFDVIIDSTGSASGRVWPWLKVGGVFIIERYKPERVRELIEAMNNDLNTWLPFEEIMCVTQFPVIALVEKRNPRVVPYLDIIVGSSAPIVPEAVYSQRGAKRVVVPKELLEKL